MCVFSFYQELKDQENRPHRPILLQANPGNPMYFQPPPTYEKYLQSPGAVIYSNQPINTITQSTPMGNQPVSTVYPTPNTYPPYAQQPPTAYPMQMYCMGQPPPYSPPEHPEAMSYGVQQNASATTPPSPPPAPPIPSAPILPTN